LATTSLFLFTDDGLAVGSNKVRFIYKCLEKFKKELNQNPSLHLSNKFTDNQRALSTVSTASFAFRFLPKSSFPLKAVMFRETRYGQEALNS
jgi:hypothetical protein